MATATEQVELLQAWCQEAVREFGDDWPSIHRHIRKKLAELPESERKHLLQNIVLALTPMNCEPH
jgi:tRNA(Ile2) C34 agmatinyltransferase TiaS